ncbi:SpoIIE family protein phosphatase/ATP-binding protein [Streptomyces sioyaensis]|uniref:SpoIIE family protein phosphatase/ATP-binding protein n=1 Tax=Streptomyces sioyaensis TaxID=67364 RepID=UPI001F47B067|nr:SpoIIE family protein phosphatase/ATP-binding protein [Streptomyces sioyaensis]
MREFFRRERDDSPGSSRSPGRHLHSLLATHSVAGQVFVLQLALTVLLVVAAVVALFLQSERAGTQEARQRSEVGAETFAHAPGTLAAMQSADPTARLQPAAEAARKASGADLIVALSPDGIRWTHPDPRLIGKPVTRRPSLDGKAHTATFTTSVGPAVSTTVPVRARNGSIAGLVSVAIRVHQADEWTVNQLPPLLGSAAAALLLVTGGAAWVSNRLRRQTHGLHPAEMRRMYDHHDAVLHAVREGVLIISSDGVLLLANDEARRLLELPADAERRPVADLGLTARLSTLLASGRPATDEVHLAGDRLLAVNVRPTAPRSGPAGTVVTLRDTTELRALAGRAGVAQERLKMIYDAGLRIGTTLDVGRTAEELAAVAVPRFADVVTVELLEPVLHGDEPAAGANAVLRRTAIRGLPEESATYRVGEALAVVAGTPRGQVLASGRPVLVRDLRTADEWRRQDVAGTERVLERGIRSLIAVPLQARGVVLGLAHFWRAETSGRFEAEDMTFAEELTARAAVAIDNARRYSREHTTAVTLQRSLLPQALPEQSALEVAHRYLPAHAGVGGDWFDVIPLPGCRVALVVGDVVGHGLHAAATMGRLRTAVHNFSALDLPPDELLGHLDELVSHIDTDEARAAGLGTGDGGGPGDEGLWPGGVPGDTDGGPAGAGRTGITGATCLYAIYDPVGGRTTLARAGHPGPAVIGPDGTVSFPEVPVSPPLGLGGSLPVETAELTLSEGSRLVLYTDGLVENRDRAIDTGLELLRTALAAGADRTPEQTCTAVLEAMLPDHPSDDIALLVARTRLLDPARVADWEVASDPAAVAPVRAACLDMLESWGLTAAQFTTELILSELLTNAIRYGAQPIRVRLLYDRSLICEVSDGTSTSPHLRRAATTDEGGRGLFLVAQFAQRWGTRYTPGGKVIWTEQSLDGSRPDTGPESADDVLDQWGDVPEL